MNAARKTRQPIWKLIIGSFLGMTCALLFLWLGIAIPSYFRSVAPIVLQFSGSMSTPWSVFARDYLNEGQLGVASLILETAPRTPEGNLLKEDLQTRLRERPELKYAGGPEPFYLQFVRNAPYRNAQRPEVIPTLLPPENRMQMLGFLEESLNSNVTNLLEARNWTGWQTFLPVFSKAGQPLDAAILTTALLEQSRSLSPAIRSDLLARLQSKEPDRLEPIFAAILTLGNHLNWNQLTTLTSRTPTPEDLLFASSVAGKNPTRLKELLAALALIESSEDVYLYLRRQDERGWQGLRLARQSGGFQALNILLKLQKPPYTPPGFWTWLPEPLTRPKGLLMNIASNSPQMGLALRAASFAASGFVCMLLLRLWFLPPAPKDQGRRRLIHLDTAIGSILIALLLWVVIEPGLLHFEPNEEGNLQINLASVFPEAAESSDSSAMIDQVTLIVLITFLVLQLLVFVFCLIKIAEIRRQPVPAETKLRLLENEENLFDLGLYVGLGGTVFSLILVVLKFVDASLMAAYASTLFGIIFVATLKIGFLRPFRRRLILGQPTEL